MKGWNPLRLIYQNPQQRGERLIRAMLRGWHITTWEPEPGIMVVVTLAQSTYRTKVFLWVDAETIRCTATTDVCIDRGLLRRELLLQLLEDNSPTEPGMFMLVPAGEDRLMGLTHVVDIRSTTPLELRRTVQRLIWRFQNLVTRLYSMELIMTGPEPFAPVLPTYQPPGANDKGKI